jgi:hypothetical protein
MSRVIEQDFAEQAGDRRADELTVYTCPDCGGVMWQAEEAPPIRFRCHVGHAYAPQVLLAQKSEELESALWRCVRLLREKSTLSRQMVVRPAAGGNGSLTERIEEQAALDERHAQVIRELLGGDAEPRRPGHGGHRCGRAAGAGGLAASRCARRPAARRSSGPWRPLQMRDEVGPRRHRRVPRRRHGTCR